MSHPSPAHAEPDAAPRAPRSIWPMFLIGLVALALFALMGQWLRTSKPFVDQEEAAKTVNRLKIIQDLHKDDAEKLGSYAWANRAESKVRIPLERAKELTLASINQQTPRAAYPIVDPAAAPPAAAASPAAAAATPAKP